MMVAMMGGQGEGEHKPPGGQDPSLPQFFRARREHGRRPAGRPADVMNVAARGVKARPGPATHGPVSQGGHYASSSAPRPSHHRPGLPG
jgi:hypothetical protein